MAARHQHRHRLAEAAADAEQHRLRHYFPDAAGTGRVPVLFVPPLMMTAGGVVERSRQVAALPSLGLLYLAAATPEGHELTYHEAPADGDPAYWEPAASDIAAYNSADLINLAITYRLLHRHVEADRLYNRAIGFHVPV